MKVRAICLEVFADMTDAEFIKLGEGSVLNNMLIFSGKVTGEESFEIPMDMKLVRHQKEGLVVEQTPKDAGYFGRANSVSFRINNKFYRDVEQNGSYGQISKDNRYKLTVKIKDR